MCDGCEAKPDDLLIPQMEPDMVPDMHMALDPLPIDQFVATFAPRRSSQLPRGLLFWNESRRQNALEGDGG